MTGRSHLTWTELLSLHDEPNRGSVGRRHVDECRNCRARLERLSSWIESLPAALEPGAPDVWMRRAEQHAVPRGFFAPMKGSHMAQIVFDSAADRLAGVRGGGRGEREWLLASERIEIEVAVSDPGEDTPFGVSGQLFAVDGEPPSLQGCRIALEVEGERREETLAVSSGEFLLRERPSGPFRIVVEGDGWRVATPTLTP